MGACSSVPRRLEDLFSRDTTEKVETLHKAWFHDSENPVTQVGINQMNEYLRSDEACNWVLRETAAFDKFYNLGDNINKGELAEIYKATKINEHEHAQTYAVKRIPKNREDDKKAKQKLFAEVRAQVQAMVRLKQNDHIITLEHVFEDDEYIYIVMEYCSGGNLRDRIDTCPDDFTEEYAAKIVKQMLLAVNSMHEQKIAHLNLNLEHFVFESDEKGSPKYNTIKLIGFRNTTYFAKEDRCYVINAKGKEVEETHIGTPRYMAPEVWLGKYSKAADMWAIGILTFVMVFNFQPFDCYERRCYGYEKRIEKGFDAHIRERFRPYGPTKGPFFPEGLVDEKGVSDSCMIFIAKLLRKVHTFTWLSPTCWNPDRQERQFHMDPRKRPTVKVALDQYWIKHHCDVHSAESVLVHGHVIRRRLNQYELSY